MDIREITFFQCSDGTMCATMDEARAHEVETAFKRWFHAQIAESDGFLNLQEETQLKWFINPLAKDLYNTNLGRKLRDKLIELFPLGD